MSSLITIQFFHYFAGLCGFLRNCAVLCGFDQIVRSHTRAPCQMPCRNGFVMTDLFAKQIILRSANRPLHVDWKSCNMHTVIILSAHFLPLPFFSVFRILHFNWLRKRLLYLSAGPEVKLLAERGKVPVSQQIRTEAR